MDIRRLMTVFAFALFMVLGYRLFLAPRDTPPVGPVPATSPDGDAAANAAALPQVEHVLLGEGDPNMTVDVTNENAAVSKVVLNNQRQEVGKPTPLTLMQESPGAMRPFATVHVAVGEALYPLESVGGRPITWHVTQRPDKAHPNEVHLEQYILDAKNVDKVITLEKIFRLDPASYTLTVTHAVHNLTQGPLNVSIDQTGPINLSRDDIRSDSRTYRSTVYHAESKAVNAGYKWILHGTQAKATAPEYLGSFTGGDRCLWVSAGNRFFVAIERPLPLPGAPLDYTDDGRPLPRLDYLNKAELQKLVAAKEADQDVLGVKIYGNPVIVPAGQTVEESASAFLGPKKGAILNGDAAAAPGTPAFDYYTYKYGQVIELNGRGLYSLLTFPALARGILWLLDKIRTVTFGNYGVAIMVMVIIIRLLLHPLTRSSQVSMIKLQRQMAELQPEMERIKKKYKDKAQQSAELMKLQKERGVNPAASIMGCLPMFLQIPIWGALYTGLAADIDLRHAPFIRGWINDLSAPDTVAKFNTPFYVPLVGTEYMGANFVLLNLLPILLGVVFYFQMQIQMANQPKPTDDTQAQTQKMTKWMFLLVPFFLYNAPSGLNLYIFASTLGGLFDTYLVRRHLRAQGLLPPKATDDPLPGGVQSVVVTRAR